MRRTRSGSAGMSPAAALPIKECLRSHAAGRIMASSPSGGGQVSVGIGGHYPPQGEEERAMTARVIGWLGLLVVIGVVGVAFSADPQVRLPLGPHACRTFGPADDPITPEKIALGKQLFWDKRWSKSKTVACVSCHPPDHGWSDPQRFSTNFEGKATPRHAPTIVNRLFSDQQLWTGVRPTLEEQARLDSNRTDETVVPHPSANPAYPAHPLPVFGSDLHADAAAKA